MEIRPRNGELLARWGTIPRPRSLDDDVVDTIPLTASGVKPAADLIVHCQVAPSVERAALGLETSYHHLLLAVLGLSGYSLVCLAYMIFQARALSMRARARRRRRRRSTWPIEPATSWATACSCCRTSARTWSSHLDLIDRFVTEEGPARAAAASRLGVAAGTVNPLGACPDEGIRRSRDRARRGAPP